MIPFRAGGLLFAFVVGLGILRSGDYQELLVLAFLGVAVFVGVSTFAVRRHRA